MGKRSRVILFLLLLITGMILPFQSVADSNQSVHVIPVEQTVERGLEAFLDRAITDAVEDGADHILLEMDTPGGAVNAATNIVNKIQATDVPISTFVKNEDDGAISAGAYIALYTDNIYMQPGAQIGNASVIDGAGNAADQKVAENWATEMRTAAASSDHDRPPDIAERMVNPDNPISINANEALENNYAEGIEEDREGVLAALDLTDAEVVEQDLALAETMTRWITHPAMISVLLAVGAVGLITEFFTPGFGIAGIVGLSSLGLFFFGHLFAGFAGWESLILLIIGIILIVVEIVFTGFGLFGLLGVGSIIGSIYLASFDTSQIFLSILLAVGAAGVAAFVMFKYFGRIGLMKRLVLQDEVSSEEGTQRKADKERLLNETGVALTPLRPAGIGEINDAQVDVVSEGSFIEKGKSIQVVRTDGASIVVREIK
ncbi:nodulation protein NfeD [Geomicrobium sp. JCM 19039]|uniref:NfeD family protein n=1 Tax=Geomicrobium sp. JCM 19039 TaxID=1460636 RepID=UPI00045F49A8|nr:NfeD family protein [Geomicrobium sp. JCM 19039]GAK11460.1 hypothetical protein JCM19039_1157 [Geomicrobium sp. JCM 19039]